jgi:tetratricopeptide (TPR) repeat protein
MMIAEILRRTPVTLWKRAVLLVFMVGMTATAMGQTPTGQRHGDDVLMARQGVDQLLRVDFDAALATFARLEQRYPGYPLTGFLRGAVWWVRAEAEQDAARVNAQNKTIEELEAAIARAEATIAEGNKDPRWQLARGNAYFFAARIFNDQGELFKAYRYGRKGRDILRDLIAEHPEMNDAYFVLGMYEYITGSIPRGLRWLAYILDLNGDRALGVQYLERATVSAPVMAPEAARILLAAAAIQPEHNRPCDYLPLAEYMNGQFDTNPHYSGALQLIYVHCGYPQKALTENVRARRLFLEKYPGLVDTLDIIELQAYRSLGDLKKVEAMRPVFRTRDPAFWYLAKAQTLDLLGEDKNAKRMYDDLFWFDPNQDNSALGFTQVPDWVMDQVEISRKTPFTKPVPRTPGGSSVLKLYEPTALPVTPPDKFGPPLAKRP